MKSQSPIEQESPADPIAGHALRGWRAALFSSLVLLAGCQRSTELTYVSSPEVEALDEPLRVAVGQELQKWFGTPAEPKLFGDEGGVDAEHLKRGARVYQRNCQQCHGVSGDGNGPAAEYLVPRPRDYRRGIFKFSSTEYGDKPRREDLLRTVTRGIAGTSMPSFRRLPKHDLEAVIDYVLSLTHRGELEVQLAAQADSDGEVTPEAAQELAEGIRDRWRGAEERVIEPLSKMPAYTPESVAAGAEIFQKRECFKCHGRDGRGGLAGGIDAGKDAWGFTDPAADLTSGMLHGGQRPLDVYRRIYGGINGSPMPAFKDALAAEPDAIWHLTHYILHLADQRRRGVQFQGESTPAGAHAPADEAAPTAEPTPPASAEESPE
jgi:mono/diheme cytochrome c family protein